MKTAKIQNEFSPFFVMHLIFIKSYFHCQELTNTMKRSTDSQIQQVRELLSKCISELICHDGDIFNIELIEPPKISDDARVLERKLHETTINHRLAYYIEKNIRNTDLNFYKVDIEYNRFYNNSKILSGVEGNVRPDILVHTRTDNTVDQQHYLVIEAKKAQITSHDIIKIKRFIKDSNYNYLFGLTISYCEDANLVLSNLYYFNGKKIIYEPINIPK